MDNDENSFVGKILQKIQDDMAEMRKQIAVLAHGQVALQKEMSLIRQDLTEIRVDLRDLRHSIGILAITSDDHNSRLTRIEEMFVTRLH